MEIENNLKKFKYIVYETTNLVNNKIYIGVHQTEDPNKFDGYIGCGVYCNQPYTYMHAKTAFQFAVKKHGPSNFKRKTLAVFNTPHEAFLLEEELVNEEFLKRDDVYNMILGGEGGYFLSNRVKVFRYDENGNYLDEYLSFALAALAFNCDYTNISYAVRKKCKACECFWSTDKLDKLDLSLYNIGDNHAKKIYCYLQDGSFYKAYSTQTQAEKDLHICAGSIRKSCIDGHLVKQQYYFLYVYGENYSIAKSEWIKERVVYKYASDGTFLEEYDSQEIAEYENPGCNISKSIRLKTPDENGNMWGLDKLQNYNKPNEINAKKPVAKYTLNGELVQVYPSATAAANENGTSVWKVLAGTNKTHKQHIYKYC